MNVRADIVELLTAGWSDRRIANTLHIRTQRIRDARRTLGLPRHQPGPTPSAAEDIFWRRAQHTPDGHLLWPYSSRVLRTGHEGPRSSVARIAFRIKHGREPEGHVRPGCGNQQCVHPAHLEDRAIRQRTEATFTAIFGKVS